MTISDGLVSRQTFVRRARHVGRAVSRRKSARFAGMTTSDGLVSRQTFVRRARHVGRDGGMDYSKTHPGGLVSFNSFLALRGE